MSKDSKGCFKKIASGQGFQCGLIKKTKFDIKKNLTDYNYYFGSATQAADHETTMEFIINFIKKTFDYGNDIGTALRDLTPVDQDKLKVSMRFSKSDNAFTRDQENKQYEMEFRSDY
jgi:hypothetical protein